MAALTVNVDHIATIRQARGGKEPDPVHAAVLAEMAGADGIIVHLREDRRHIQERDVRLLKEVVKTHLHLEMATTEEIVRFALDIKPRKATLVPEKRQELTTEGGIDVLSQKERIREVTARLQDAGIHVLHFVDTDPRQIDAVYEVGCRAIEIHTGFYAAASTPALQDREFRKIYEAAQYASRLGIEVHAGHGLDYHNIERLVEMEEIVEYSIGHSIISYAVFVGMERAVEEMLALVR